jgi:hypothetical protein
MDRRQADLDRRLGERRRERLAEATAQLMQDRRAQVRRAATERRITTARLCNWMARYDAAKGAADATV